MSWIDYVKNMTDQGADEAGLYALTGGAVCAQSDKLKVSPQEVEMIRNCSLGTDTKLQINGNSCIMIAKDEEFVRGKTKQDVDNQKLFYYCAISNLYVVVVGMTGAGERKAATIATSIAQHLKSANQ